MRVPARFYFSIWLFPTAYVQQQTRFFAVAKISLLEIFVRLFFAAFSLCVSLDNAVRITFHSWSENKTTKSNHEIISMTVTNRKAKTNPKHGINYSSEECVRARNALNLRLMYTRARILE